MNRTINEVDNFFLELEEEEKAIREDRGRRYGGKFDTLENIATFGSDGAIVAFWECAMRIRNSFGKPKMLKDLHNAVNDARNYAGFILKIEEDEQATEVKEVGVQDWKPEYGDRP